MKFANCTVLDSENRNIRLALLWQKQPVIFIFLRHFACLACRAHAIQVWEKRESYEKTGAKLVFIGNGDARYIKNFQEELGLTKALVLTDPSLESFSAAGFQKGFFALVQPKSAINALKLLKDGHKQSAPSTSGGSHWQLGGVIAISPQGRVLYQFISEAFGDFPPESDTATMVPASESVE